MIPISGPMPVIGTTFRHHLYLRASRASEVCAGVVGGHSELFQALDWGGNDRPRCGDEPAVVTAAALHVAGPVATVDHDSILVASGSGYRAAGQIPFTASTRPVKTRYSHWLKQKQ